MAFIAIYDANVLYPASLRDLLIRLAQTRLFQAKWTDQILDEMVDAIVRAQPELADRLERRKGGDIQPADESEPSTVKNVYLLTPESVGGAMVEAPRAQGEVLATIAETGDLPADWASTDGLAMEVARIDVR